MSWTQADADALCDLILKAEKEGKWLYCSYQSLWFTPQQLRDANANGKFRWGVVNWQLRDPRERVAGLERMATGAQQELERVRKQLEESI